MMRLSLQGMRLLLQHWKVAIVAVSMMAKRPTLRLHVEREILKLVEENNKHTNNRHTHTEQCIKYRVLITKYSRNKRPGLATFNLAWHLWTSLDPGTREGCRVRRSTFMIFYIYYTSVSGRICSISKRVSRFRGHFPRSLLPFYSPIEAPSYLFRVRTACI